MNSWGILGVNLGKTGKISNALPASLLVPQRFDGPELCGFAGRIESEADAHDHREDDREQDRSRGHECRPAGEVRNKIRAADAEDDAEEAAEEAEDDRL